MRSSSGKNYKMWRDTLRNIILLTCMVVLMFSCQNDDNNQLNCNNEVVVSSFHFENAESAVFEINAVEINGDTLTIQISSGGCSGDSWWLCLVDSGAVAESFPPQRQIRFVLRNDESCLAYLTRSFSFNINDLRTEGNSVILHIDNHDESVEYTY